MARGEAETQAENQETQRSLGLSLPMAGKLLRDKVEVHRLAKGSCSAIHHIP